MEDGDSDDPDSLRNGQKSSVGREKGPVDRWTRQDKTRQDKARQDKTRQDKTRQDKTRQDKTRQDKTRQDKTRQDKTRQDKTRQDKTRQDKTKQDKARIGGERRLLLHFVVNTAPWVLFAIRCRQR